MVDYADWQEWADEATLNLMLALRREDWLSSRAGRMKLLDAFDRLADLRVRLDDYVPTVSELRDDQGGLA